MRCRLDVYHPFELNREDIVAVAAATGFKPTFVERTLAPEQKTYDSPEHEFRRNQYGQGAYFSHWLGQFHDQKNKPYENGALVLILPHNRHPHLEKDNSMLFAQYAGICLRTRRPVGSGMSRDEMFDWLATRRFPDDGGRIDQNRVVRLQGIESIINEGMKKLRWLQGLQPVDLQTRTFAYHHLLCFNYILTSK